MEQDPHLARCVRLTCERGLIDTLAPSVEHTPDSHDLSTTYDAQSRHSDIVPVRNRNLVAPGVHSKPPP
jgi:hypothetical protein